MDRGSGSGVFARDADAFVDILELSLPAAYEDEAKEKYGDWCIPCKIDFTLREFAKIAPVNCFYSYPLLRMDEDGWLDDARAADIERSMKSGREMGTLKSQVNKEQRVQKLKDLVKRDREFGRVKTIREYADEIGVEYRTVQRYMKDDPEILADFHGYDMT